APPGRRRQKLYKTGDLGRWLPHGNIQFLGRIDQQVKIRGQRIEPGEIESQLVKHDLIRETVVLDKKDENSERYLCTYIVLTDGAALNKIPDLSKDLKDYLSYSLPNYMIPSYFMVIEKIPLTPNGKIDRKALPIPVLETGDQYIAPRDAIEEKLAAIWAEVLGRDSLSQTQPSIGIDDNFFRLGGHSLKAARITAKIYEELHVKVPLVELFKSQTLRGLSEFIKKSSQETFIEIQAVEQKEYYELSFNQKRLWILHQTDPNKNSFNMPEIIMINHQVEETLIRQTLNQIIKRHEGLRTGFKEINGSTVQYVAVTTHISFENIDISSMEENRKEIRLTTIINEFIRKPFHLDEPPLIRSLLVKMNQQQYIFAYNLHHIVTDGWSMGILERDFHRIYQAYRKGIESPIHEKPGKITYKDFAYWHNRQMEHAANKEISREFWIRFLKEELPVLHLPQDFNQEGKEKAGARSRFVIPRDIKDALNHLSKKHNITLFTLMYSVYTIFLSLVSGQKIVVTAILNAGRDHPSCQDIVGFFINTILFKTGINQEDVFIHFAVRVQESVLEFFKHQGYPLELVLDEVGVKYPQVTTSFNMLNIHNTETIPLENRESLHQPNYEMLNVKFDIEPFVTEYQDGIEINVSYNKSIFKAENMEYMMKKYQKLVEFFARNPYKRLKDYKETRKRKTFRSSQ
ncbi:MAG: hypothetical protein JSV88_29880, partial [Candidatus Aminicenantes bacterium]